MKRLTFTGFLLMIAFSLSAQKDTPDDTSITKVDLEKFQLDKKMMKVENGRVVMYFNQEDYLGKTMNADTIRITPKYADDDVVASLLKEGKAKVFSRLSQSFVNTIQYHLDGHSGVIDRVFEFEDGEGFFENLAYITPWNAVTPDSNKTDTAKKIQVKDFAYNEEFPDWKDTKKIKTKDYFPAKPSTCFVYDPNNGYGETDTNICKTTLLDNQPVFYFAECFNKYNLTSVDVTCFGSGLYFYRNDSLFTIDARFESEIEDKNVLDAHLLLPAMMAPGDSSTMKLEDNREVFTYLSKGRLTIKNTIHEDCIKFKMINYWDDTIYISYIWLEKNVGLVKWMRETGRIDELIGTFK